MAVPKRWTVLFITVTLLVVPIFLYYTVYIRSRTTYLTNRDFRQLAGISNQLEDRIEQLKDLFFRAVTQTVLPQTQARRSSSFEPFKIPILVGFVAAVLFLFLTQKDLANSSWTFVTAATTGIPAVFKLLSLFQSDNTGHKSFNA